ncbi:MAG: hypothetical protein LBT00_03880 [Spirochaetaceae bacterium]|nr:hypothetical protein [Spirochaetaceae bacterium]
MKEVQRMTPPCHCERAVRRAGEAIGSMLCVEHGKAVSSGLLRFARNDGLLACHEG